MRRILSIAVLLGLAAGTSAQSVQPSNATLTPPLSGTYLQLRLRNTNNNRALTRFSIAPLTLPGGLNATSIQLSAVSIDGVLVLTDANNANAIGRGDIAYTSCEQIDGAQFTPDEVVAAAANQRPKAIVLYASRNTACTLAGSFGYDAIYTMTNATESIYLERVFGYVAPGRMVEGLIVAENNQFRGNGGNNNDGGPAPTTAVAMSILYSITGIITLLFLAIICSGALRAHRNPERYGPRRAVGGRPRQSRAKGMARAILETIPIVKFGDPEPAKPGSERDVELADGNSGHKATPAATTDTDGSKDAKDGTPELASDGSTVPPATGSGVASGMGQAESVKSGEEHVGGDGELGCTICTEYFTAGEDVRVLPCHHKYHPACIDPWLLNVSGTCPLCRHDLDPAGSTPEGTEATTDLPPPLAPEETPTADPVVSGRRRMTRFLDLHRLRTATPDERIAALRTLREQSRAEGTTSEEPHTVEPARRHRLRDRLRFGGRSQSAVTDVPAPATAATTAEAPQPTTRT